MEAQDGKSEEQRLREIFAKPDKPKTTRKRVRNSTKKELSMHHEQIERCEQWARLAVTFGEAKSQIALISLLHTIEKSNDPAGLAMYARNAAFGRCDAIIDDVIGHAVAGKVVDHKGRPVRAA